MQENESLYGVVTAVLFKNDENGYAVLRFETDDGGNVTVTGCMPQVMPGEELSLVGKWKTHASYGEQFIVEYFERQMPSGVAGMIAYLSSGVIKGVGPKLAKRIVDRYREKTFDVLELDPERLTEIPGITPKKAREIGEAFARHHAIRQVAEFLASYSLPMEIAARLYRHFGDHVMDILKANPYIMCDEEFGLDFGLCDEVARDLGIDESDDRRIGAGLVFAMRFNLTNGHTFVPKEKLVAAVTKLLNCEKSVILENLTTQIALGKIANEFICSEDALYLLSMYQAETYLAQRLKSLVEKEYTYDFDIAQLVAELEGDLGLSYAPLQKKAIEESAKNGLVILTGGPGTGKTTTVKGMLAIFEALGLETLLAAPTGRAAKRMSELCGVPAATIHRLLEATKTGQGELAFQRNEYNPLKADVIVLDEVSMVDINLMRALLLAMEENTRLVLVGDYDQLPPVGPGNFLRDLIKSERIPLIALNEIFRQEKLSMIVSNAHGINIGEMPKSAGADGDFFIMKKQSPLEVVQTVVDLCSRRLPEYYGFKPSQIQVITPSKKQGAGTVSLNKHLQEALNPPGDGKGEKRLGDTIFRVGDRVMQMHNDYDILWKKKDGGETGSGIFNGDIGEILAITPFLETVQICFDDKLCDYSYEMLFELDLAYAITVHKAQGSEFDAVVFAAGDGISHKLLTRSVLYTAITRAKSLLVIVGGEETIQYMVNNNTRNRRYSALRARIARD